MLELEDFTDARNPRIGECRLFAFEDGLRMYFGEPCCHGHRWGVRFTANSVCVECSWNRNAVRSRKAKRNDRDRKRRQRAREKARFECLLAVLWLNLLR